MPFEGLWREYSWAYRFGLGAVAKIFEDFCKFLRRNLWGGWARPDAGFAADLGAWTKGAVAGRADFGAGTLRVPSLAPPEPGMARQQALEFCKQAVGQARMGDRTFGKAI